MATLIHKFHTSRPTQNCRHFPDDIFKCIFLYENVWIAIKISPKIVSGSLIINIPALVQIMAWHRPCFKFHVSDSTPPVIPRTIGQINLCKFGPNIQELMVTWFALECGKILISHFFKAAVHSRHVLSDKPYYRSRHDKAWWITPGRFLVKRRELY